MSSYDHLIRPDCPLPAGTSVVGYCRDSGNEDQERSVSQQREAIAEYCRTHGLILERTYFDAAQTGSSAEKRDDLNRMLENLRERFRAIRNRHKREAQTAARPFGLVVWKSNRLSRDALETTHLKSDLRMRGITIVSLITTTETGNASLDAVIEAFQHMQDEQLTDEISQNARRGLAQLVGLRDTDPEFRRHNPGWPTSDGGYLGIMPGPTPTGFIGQRVVTGVNRRGEVREAQRLVPDPEIAPLIRMAWEMRYRGAQIKAIHQATTLFRNASSYSRMFANRIYTGDLDYGGKRYENFVPALIPREWFEVEQQRIAARSEMAAGRKAAPDYHPRRAASRHILSGLVKCGASEGVEHPMQASSVPARGRRGAWDFYICGMRKNSREQRCSMPRISAKALEKAVIQFLLEKVFTLETLQPLAVEVTRTLSKGRADNAAQLAAAERRLTDVRRAIERIMDAIESTGTSESLETRLRKRESDQVALMGEIARLRRFTEQQPMKLPTQIQIEDWLESIRAALTSDDIELVRQTVKQMVVKVVVKGNKKAGLHYMQPAFGLAPSLNSLTPTDTHTYPMRAIQIAEIVVPNLPVGGQYDPDLPRRCAEARALRQAGHTYEEIAASMGVSRQTAWNWINLETMSA